jgi:penicillin-binding protein 2
LGNAKFDCWKEEGHGAQNMILGLMNSCNVYFYNVGRSIGCDPIETYAKLFGYGKSTGIDIPDEVSGIVPGKSWKRARGKGAWYEGETLNYTIGQGYLSVTPIQVLVMAAVIANEGFIVKPYVAAAIDKKAIAAPRIRNIGLKDSTIKTIRSGLYEVVNNENGTGRRARAQAVVAAGKTGTAQNPQGRTHAWFCGFASFDRPTVCVVVMLEHGGKGGIGAAEVARSVFEEANRKGYFPKDV